MGIIDKVLDHMSDDISFSLDSEPLQYNHIKPTQKTNIMEVIHLTPQLWQTAQINELASSLIDFQDEFNSVGIKKDAKNPHLRNTYVSLDNILHTVRPLLVKHGLVVTQDLAGGYLITTLLHASGQFKGAAMEFNPMAGNKGTNKLQEIGGGITYARRYSLSALLAISVDVDDDANSMKVDPSPKKTTTKKAAPKKITDKQVQGVIKWAKDRGYKITVIEDNYTLTATQKATILKAIK